MAKIKDQITKETWKKGERRGDCRCLGSWIDDVYKARWIELYRVRLKVADRIGFQENSLIATIIRWNDSPTRTFEDVKQLIEELDI